VTVLLRSAMYVSPIELAVWWIAFSLVVAPREHRFGWRRVFAGFVIGHVGATVSTAALQMWEAQAFPNPDLIPERIDVGASYGFFAFAALATYHGSARRRLLWAAGLVAAAAGGNGPGFRMDGHRARDRGAAGFRVLPTRESRRRGAPRGARPGPAAVRDGALIRHGPRSHGFGSAEFHRATDCGGAAEFDDAAEPLVPVARATCDT